MEKWKRRTVELLTSIAFGSGAVSVVPYYPQKCMVYPFEQKYFRRSTPERHNISSKRIYGMLAALENEKRANMHSIMLLSGGEVISECSVAGYSSTAWHISHSMAKTVTGMIVGVMVDRGLLDTERRLVDIFPEISYRDKKFPDITIHHLLSMTAGVEFAEAGVVTETDWTATFFSSAVRFAPGSQFAYNSMNSYILARVCERVGGRSFCEIARKEFFTPLGIESYFWEKSPEGVEKGGWGLYLSPESWARIGFMLMNGGSFMGQRILSENWISRSTSTHATVPEINGGFNYGYHIWVSREGGELLFNGMLGQNVWICPKNNIMAVMTGGNNELFAASPALEIVRGYLGGEMHDKLDRSDVYLLREKEMRFFRSRRWVRPCTARGGLLSRLGILGRRSFDFAWYGVLGEYAFAENSAGILPLIVQAMQNNFSPGIRNVSLSKVGKELWLSATEGNEEYKINVGLYGYNRSVINVRGESYAVFAMGDARWGRGGEREYRIELLFSETASVRRIRIKKTLTDRISVELSETPNHRLVESMLDTYSKTYPKLGIGLDILERRIGKGMLREGLRQTFCQTLVGADTSLPGYMTILDAENKKTADRIGRTKFVKIVVDKFFKQSEKDKK